MTPGGVDSSKSGTTGDGDVIELKLDSVVVDDEHDEGDGAIAVGNPVGVAEVGSVSMPREPLPRPFGGGVVVIEDADGRLGRNLGYGLEQAGLQVRLAARRKGDRDGRLLLLMDRRV